MLFFVVGVEFQGDKDLLSIVVIVGDCDGGWVGKWWLRKRVI